MFRFQSLDEDCPLEEEEGLVDEEDDIDQFNDDTFGAGAIDDDWQEEHARLAGLDERVRGDGSGGVSSEAAPNTPLPAPSSSAAAPASPSLSAPGLGEEGSGDGSALAESLSRLIMETDPGVAGVSGVIGGPGGPSAAPPSSLLGYQLHQRGTAPLQASPQVGSHSIWENSMGFGPVGVSPALVPHVEDSPLMSIIKEVGLPKRPPVRGEEGRDLSERVPPPRSSSPVIGSPPVRAVPIGTPPKQPFGHGLNQHILCPTAVHVRAPVHHRYPSTFPDRLSPNQLLNMANAPMRGHPFPSGVGPVLSQIQRAQLISPQGALSHSAFSRSGGPSPLLAPKQLMAGGGGFRPFFGQPPSRSMAPPPVRPDTTHLHPQHRRLLTQRLQNRSDHSRGDRAQRVGDRGRRERDRDPYSNLMTPREKDWVARIQMMQLQSTDPYLDDYYYQNYFEKLEKRPGGEQCGRDSVRKEVTKLITPQVAKLEHTYRPVQFAGSLGKLTVSSVNNPRKMIDAVVTSRSDDEEKREKQVWNKRRQILYTVEKLYSLLLEVQDFEKKFLQTAEEQRESLLEQHKAHTLQLYSTLTDREGSRISDELFIQIMSLRKGKRLIARILPFLGSEQAAAVVMAIARNLPAIAKKDKQDQVLSSLVEPCAAVIQSLSSAGLTDLLQELQGPAQCPSDTRLHKVLHNKFGLTFLYLILSEGERLQSADPHCELMEDNRWTELVFSVTRELLQTPPSSLATPFFTPPSLLSLFSRYVDRQKLDTLQDKLQISVQSR
ncbi:PATL1 protein, partial [Atractosteus spatula]|nr:PATL1 protein [Atractosteus spatula]